jgi:hypothetical protein
MSFSNKVPLKHLLLSVIALMTLLGSNSVHAAGSATLSLSANTTAVTGSTVAVSIFETGDNIDTITADLSYDQNQLKFVNIDDSNSAFKVDLHASGGNGAVDVTRYATDDTGNPTRLSGRQEIAVVNFAVLGTSGTTIVSTAATSLLVSDGVNEWDGVLSTANITIGATAQTGAPAPTSTTHVASPKATTEPSPAAVITTPAPVATAVSPNTKSSSAPAAQTISVPTKFVQTSAQSKVRLDRFAGSTMLLLALAATFFLLLRWRRRISRQKS